MNEIEYSDEENPDPWMEEIHRQIRMLAALSFLLLCVIVIGVVVLAFLLFMGLILMACVLHRLP